MESTPKPDIKAVLDWLSRNCGPDASSHQEDLKVLNSLLREFPNTIFATESNTENFPLLGTDLHAVLTLAEIYDRVAFRYLCKGRIEQHKEAQSKSMALCNALSRGTYGIGGFAQQTQLRLSNLELSRGIQAALREPHNLDAMVARLLDVSRQSHLSQGDYFLTVLYQLLLSVCYLGQDNTELFYNRSSMLKARILKNFKTRYTAPLDEIMMSRVIFLRVVGAKNARKELVKLTIALSLAFDCLNLKADKQNQDSIDALIANVNGLMADLSPEPKSLFEQFWADVCSKVLPQPKSPSKSPPSSPSLKKKPKRLNKSKSFKVVDDVSGPPQVAEPSQGYSVRVFTSSNNLDQPAAPKVKKLPQYAQRNQKRAAQASGGAYDLLRSGVLNFGGLPAHDEQLEERSEKTTTIFNKFFNHGQDSQSTSRMPKRVGKSFADLHKPTGGLVPQDEVWEHLKSLKPWRINSAQVFTARPKTTVIGGKTTNKEESSVASRPQETFRGFTSHRVTASMSSRVMLERSVEESNFAEYLKEKKVRNTAEENTIKIIRSHTGKPSGLSALDGMSTARGVTPQNEPSKQPTTRKVRAHEVRSYSNAFLQMKTNAEIADQGNSGSVSNFHSRKPSSAFDLQGERSRVSLVRKEEAAALITVPKTLIRQNSAGKLQLMAGEDELELDEPKIASKAAANKSTKHQMRKTHSHTTSLNNVYLQQSAIWSAQALRNARFTITPEEFMIERPLHRVASPKVAQKPVQPKPQPSSNLEEVVVEMESPVESAKLDSRTDKHQRGTSNLTSHRNFNFGRSRSGEHAEPAADTDRNFGRKDTMQSRASRLVTESREELDGSPKQHELESDSLHQSQHMRTFGTTAMAVTAAIQLGNKRNSKLSVPVANRSGANSVRADSEKRSSVSRKEDIGVVVNTDSNPTTSRKERELKIIKEAETSKKRTMSIKNVLDSYGLARIKELALGINGSGSVPRKSSNFASVAISQFQKANKGKNQLKAPELGSNLSPTQQGSTMRKKTPRQMSSIGDAAFEETSFKKQISLRYQEGSKNKQRSNQQGTLLDLDDQLSPNPQSFKKFDGANQKNLRFAGESELSLESDNRTPRQHGQGAQNQPKESNSALNRSHQNQTYSDEFLGVPTIAEGGQDLASAGSPHRAHFADDRYLSSVHKKSARNVSFNKQQPRISGGRVIASQLSQDIAASLEKSNLLMHRLHSPLHSLDGDPNFPLMDQAILAGLANETSPGASKQQSFLAKERRRRSKRLELLPQNRACEILSEFFERGKIKTKRLGFFLLRFEKALDFALDPDQIEFETTSLIGKPFKREPENIYDSSTNLLPRMRSKSAELPDFRAESGFLPIMFKTEATTFTREYTLKNHRNFEKLKVKFVSLASSGLHRGGKVSRNKPLELQFVNGQKGGFLKIGLSNHLRINGNRNNGVLAWLNLVNYLRQHVEHLDLDSLARTNLSFPPKSGVESPFTQKNQIFLKLFLLLISNRCVLVRNTLGGYQVKFLDPILKYYRDDTIESLRLKQVSLASRHKVCEVTHDKLGMITMARLGVFGPINREGFKVLEDGYFFELPAPKSKSYEHSGLHAEPADPRLDSQPSRGESLSKRKNVGLGFELNVSGSQEDSNENSHQLKGSDSSHLSDDSPLSFQGTPEFAYPGQKIEEPRAQRRARKITTIIGRTNGIHKGLYLETDTIRGFSPVQSAIFDSQPFGGPNAAKIVPFDELIGFFEDPRTRIGHTILARVGERLPEFLPFEGSTARSGTAKRVSHVAPKNSVMTPLEQLNYPRLFKFNPLLLSVPFKVHVSGYPTYVLLHLYRSPFKLSVEYLSRSNRKGAPKQEVSLAYEWIEPYLENKHLLRKVFHRQFYAEDGCIWKRGDGGEPLKILEISSQIAVQTKDSAVRDIQLDNLSELQQAMTPDGAGHRTAAAQSPVYKSLEANMGVFKIFASAMASLGSQSRATDTRSPGAGSSTTKYIHGMRYRQQPTSITKKPKMVSLDDSLFPESIVFTRIQISGELVNVALSYNHADRVVCAKMQSPGLKYCVKQIISDRREVVRLKSALLAEKTESVRTICVFNLVQTKSQLGPALKLVPRPATITPNVRWEEFSRSNGLSNALRKILFQSEVQKDISSLFDVLRYYVSIKSRVFGRVAITCSLFYTYRNFDCFLVLDLFPSRHPNLVLKLAMNKADIDTHVSTEVKHRLFDKAFIVKTLIKFSERIVFERSPAGYSRTKVRYALGSKFNDQCTFAPLSKYSMYSDAYLERKKATTEVIGIFNLRVSKQYCVASVYKHSSTDQFTVDLYFPRTRKRFCFDIYNEELLMMDKSVVQDMYTVSSSEILYLAEKCNFDYKIVCQEIFDTVSRMKSLSNKDREVTMQDKRSESIVLKLVKQQKDAKPMTSEEEEALKKANRFLMFYQWDHLLKYLGIVFNPTGTPIAKIANFKAALRETLLKHHHEEEDLKSGSYWFEASITHANSSPARFWASGLVGVSKESLLESQILLRINFSTSILSKNDKLKIWELLTLYPFKKHKMETQGNLRYQDLLLLAIKVFKDFRKNFSKTNSPSLGEFALPQLNMISYYSSNGRAYYPQKSNSSFKVVDRQYVMEQYPILLLRKVLTRQPMSLLVVMALDGETLEFARYTLAGERIWHQHKSMADIEEVIPFARRMLTQPGCRQAFADRLFHTFKNSLLLSFHRQELME